MIKEMRPVAEQVGPEKTDWWFPSHRFNSDEECFQSFCQLYFKGVQYNSDEAMVMAMALDVIDGEELRDRALEALINASSCDYYYRFEKDYE